MATTVNVKDKARIAGRDVQGATQRAAEDIQHQVADAASEATAQASQAAQRAKAEAAAYVGRQKEFAAEEVEHVGEALRRAAEKLHEENDHNIADYVDAAADGTNSLARYLREKDYSAVLRDARAMIRRNPRTAFAGLFATGVAVSRFLKASEPEETDSSPPQRSKDAAFSPSTSAKSHEEFNHASS